VADRARPLEDLVSAPATGFWAQRSVLVTGSTGLLGSWLTEALLARGANVVSLVRDSVPRSRLYAEGIASKVATVHGGVEDTATVERALNEYEVETVFHLAAQTIVGTANRSPLSTFETNIKGTWSVLEAARRVSTVKRILVASSDKAYGEQAQLPYDEDTPLAGKHPYDVSKSCADLIAATYAKTYRSPVCVTRCGNFYGGGDLNWSRLVPGTIRSVLKGERPLIRSDGTMVRDYFYIEDAAEAYLLLAEKMDDPAVRGHAFNFSNELQVDVRDMVGRVLRAMEREDLQPVILNEASNEIPHQYLTAEKARRLLGWRARFDMDEALRRTAAWYRRYLAGG
jgi:CDP-glucose 4,6-dehydratase